MIDLIRTVTKQLVEKLEDIQLPVLKRLTGNMENTGIGTPCTLCNNFWAKNKASMSAHMKKCKQSMTITVAT
jgi:exopolysaccharide biosynthesis predicted pyruvyltransferase EpsI